MIPMQYKELKKKFQRQFEPFPGPRMRRRMTKSRRERIIIDVFNIIVNPSDDIIKRLWISQTFVWIPVGQENKKKKELRSPRFKERTNWTNSVLSDGELTIIYLLARWAQQQWPQEKKEHTFLFRLSFECAYWKPQQM